jgi:hypothetical protein
MTGDLCGLPHRMVYPDGMVFISKPIKPDIRRTICPILWFNALLFVLASCWPVLPTD